MDFDGNVFAVFDAQNVVVVRTGCESGIALRGTVNAPGTLTVAGPAFPYVLAGDLNLIPGGNLSIGPGVVIKGGGYYETLDVQGGSLSALGTADQPILFTSVADDTAGGDTNGDGGDTLPAEVPWGGVVVRWATNASTQGTGTFEHCVFRHGAGEQRGMLEGSGGAVTLDDCRFEASDEDGLWLEPAVVDGVHRPPEFLVRNCVITGAADDGIQIQGNDTGLTGSIDGVIDRCTIAANGDNGITAGNGFNGTIQGCRIQANGTDGIRLRQAAPTVMNNLISDHSGNNGDGVEMSDGSNPVLTGNRIRGNVTGVWASSGSQPQLSGNSISHNLEEGLHNADSSVCLEARDNWWGHDSGPRDSSDDTASACGDYNPEGRGDRVSDQGPGPWMKGRARWRRTAPARSGT
jgi:parallel beta-helix repeat protein